MLGGLPVKTDPVVGLGWAVPRERRMSDESKSSSYYAHSHPQGKADRYPPPNGWQALAEHLRGVAKSLSRQAMAAGVAV